MKLKGKLLVTHKEDLVLLKTMDGKILFEGGLLQAIRVSTFLDTIVGGPTEYLCDSEGDILLDGDAILFRAKTCLNTAKYLEVEFRDEIERVSLIWLDDFEAT